MCPPPCVSAPLCVRSYTCLSGGKTIGIGGRAQYCPSKYRRIVPPPSESRLSCFCAFRSDFDPSNLHLQIRTCVQAEAGQSVVGRAARHWRFFLIRHGHGGSNSSSWTAASLCCVYSCTALFLWGQGEKTMQMFDHYYYKWCPTELRMWIGWADLVLHLWSCRL